MRVQHGNPGPGASSRPRQSFFVHLRFLRLPLPSSRPVSLSHCSYFPSHRLRNTPESKHNSSHFSGSFPSPTPSSDVLPLRRCCQPAGTTSKRGPTLSRSLSPSPYLMCPKKKKKTLPQAFFFSLFLQPVMRLVHSEYSSDRSVGRASLPAVTTVIGRARVAPSRDR